MTHIQSNDLALWLRELSVMFRAGETPLTALRLTTAETNQSEPIRALAGRAATLMESGESFPGALVQAVSAAAPAETLALLRTGLGSGLPPQDSVRLAISLLSGQSRPGDDPWSDRMYLRTMTGLVLIVAGALLFVLVPLLVVSVPIPGPGINLNGAIPTQALLGLARLTGSVPFPAVLLVVGAAWMAWTLGRRELSRTERGALLLDRLALGIPRLNRWAMQTATARLFRVLGTLLGHQVPLPQALHAARLAMGNRVLANNLQPAQQAVEQGQALSLVLTETDLLPPAVCRIVAEGEIASTLSATLCQLADVYDAEAYGTGRRLRAATIRCAAVGLFALALLIVLGAFLPLGRLI